MAKVYVVHCIDTEGPLSEPIAATFRRIKDLFNVDLPATVKNLKKLQNKEVDVESKDMIAELVANDKLKLNDSWDKIDAMLGRIMSDDFRNKHKDSEGTPWIYNFFCMDHVGFTGENPRKRDLGHHKIFDFYMKKIGKQDSIQWHYHPLAPVRDAHRSGSTYLNSSNIFDILCRKVIERGWFPASYRPGFHTERQDSHWFLEQWIPFDYANIRVKDETVVHPNLDNGRYGNWQRAPLSWLPYNPSHDDYQVPGSCRRMIARCLNMNARHRNLTEDDVRLAFDEAKAHGSAVLSFADHDFRDMGVDIEKVYPIIRKVSDETGIPFEYASAVEAMRGFKGIDAQPPGLKVELKKESDKTVLAVDVRDLFGTQPFLAIKSGEQFVWENMDRTDRYYYTFDSSTIEWDRIDKIGIAANSRSGVTEVIVLSDDGQERFTWNQS